MACSKKQQARADARQLKKAKRYKGPPVSRAAVAHIEAPVRRRVFAIGTWRDLYGGGEREPRELLTPRNMHVPGSGKTKKRKS